MGLARLCPLLLAVTACVTFEPPADTGSDTTSGSTSGPGPGSTDPTPTGGQPSPTETPGDDGDPSTPDPTDPPDPSSGDSDPATGDPFPPSPDPVVSELARFDMMDLGDVDGDGRLDLVTGATSFPPRVTFHPGNGDGSFAVEAAVVTEVFDFSSFVLGDVTGDGRADVLAQGTGFPPRITVYAATDAGSFAELATTELFTFTHMHAVDFDGDAHVDLLTGNIDGAPPRVLVWPGGPAGIADAPLLTADVFAYTALRGGDIDGDGHADLVTAGTGAPPRLNVYPGDGLGGLEEVVVHELKTFAQFDLGDLDGDGLGDVVTDVPGNAWVFAMYPSGRDDGPVLLDGFNFVGFELGDLDGDGRADIVARPTGEPPRVEVYLAPL